MTEGREALPAKTAEIQIRRAGPEDAGAIARVLYESFVEYKPLYTPGGFSATALDEQQVVARMSEGPVWVAEREGQIAGSVAAVIKSGSVYMRGMAVLANVRGFGVGGRLIEVVERWGQKSGFSRISLSTTPFLHSAIRLYEKHGFRRIDGQLDLFGTPLFAMEKIIR
jgi:GNAT superfamily N-acetyltransferase